MPDTLLPPTIARSYSFAAIRRVDVPVADIDWQIAAAVEIEQPDGQQWAFGGSITADVDPGATGQVRLRAAGNSAVTEPARIVSHVGPVLLGWPGLAWPTTTQHVFVEARRTSGLGGVRIIKAEVTILVDPPALWSPGPIYPDGYDPGTAGNYPPAYTTTDPYG